MKITQNYVYVILNTNHLIYSKAVQRNNKTSYSWTKSTLHLKKLLSTSNVEYKLRSINILIIFNKIQQHF
jgi:hypothetical protein